jgi:hypothetical protein
MKDKSDILIFVLVVVGTVSYFRIVWIVSEKIWA